MVKWLGTYGMDGNLVDQWVRRYWVVAAIAGTLLWGIDLLYTLGPELTAGTLLAAQGLLVTAGLVCCALWLAASTVHIQEERNRAGIILLQPAQRRQHQSTDFTPR